MPEATSLAGRLLVAMPQIGDPRFEHAVILICAHGPTHAMGIRLNHPIAGLTLGDVFRRLDVGGQPAEPDTPVLSGGPVERERGFVLHTDDHFAPDASLSIGEGLALTATREVLEAMADPARAPRRAALALGYAGWGEGQIEDELRENVWLTAEPDLDLIFDQDHETKWVRALARLGVDAAQLSSQAGRA